MTSVHREEFEFTTEIQQLLEILIHSLYTNKEIFLRELVSNASDAIDKVRFQSLTSESEVANKDLALKIDISYDKDNKQLVIKDSGVGMTKEELVQNIGTIAHSGSKNFLKNIKEAKEDINLIGQFGVGFYSAFMVADKVTVRTKSYTADATGYAWISDGLGKYSISEDEKAERGTEITLHMREDAEEYLDDFRIKDIVRRYSDFVSHPIYFKEEQINKLSAIWTKSPSSVKEEEYLEYYKYLNHSEEEPFARIHLSYDAPIHFYSLVYIPKKVPWDMKHQAPESWKSVRLYAQRVFVTESCKDLLPEYLKFVRGVVDSDDLPLNVSRETLQENRIIPKINKNLVKKILEKIVEISEEDTEKYQEFWGEFGTFLKQGYRSEYNNRDNLVKLFRFNTSNCDDSKPTVSLEQYVERMKPNQEEIYYLTAEHREALENNPNLEIFRRKDVEVLYLVDTIDDFLMEDLKEYNGKKLVSAEKEDINLSAIEEPKNEENEEKETPALEEKEFDDLLGFFKNALKDKVTDVKESSRLVDSPCCLVSGKDSMGVGMQKLMQMMDQKFEMTKRIMEINAKHPIIVNMGKMYKSNPREPLLTTYCEQLFDNAQLLDGSPINPREMVPRLQKMIEYSTSTFVSESIAKETDKDTDEKSEE
ncbi:molecular chaperone HtpG [Candidatus Uabimicrobium sp. HlEnr_7]|uniref:molecular chaperone HtpG n=1 Tax=Candidatus Uabimicrobium helgolandensis TaxID=3095367 RepID=UPI003558DB38